MPKNDAGASFIRRSEYRQGEDARLRELEAIRHRLDSMDERLRLLERDNRA